MTIGDILHEAFRMWIIFTEYDVINSQIQMIVTFTNELSPYPPYKVLKVKGKHCIMLTHFSNVQRFSAT